MNTSNSYPDSSYGSAQISKVCLPLLDKTVTTEISGDFSLPDYQPEIRRLLRITASAMPTNRYASDTDIDVNGGINYFVLYTGGDGLLYCAPLNTEYSFSVPLDISTTEISSDDLLCICDTTVESSVGRVSAPRRLNIKCRMRSRVKAYANASLSNIDINDQGAGSIERLIGNTDACRLYSALGEPLLLSDDIIPDAKAGEMRVVCAEGQVFVSDTVTMPNTVTCRGEVCLKLTLSPIVSETDSNESANNIDRTPVILTRKIPFSQSVELEGVNQSCTSCAEGYCSELSVEIDEGQIHIDTAVILDITAQKNENISYIKDLYSTRRICDCRYSLQNLQSAVRCHNGNFTQSDSVLLSEVGIDPAAKIIDICGEASIDELMCGKERCILTGKSNYHILLMRDGEYSFAEIELPFRYESERVPDPADYDGSVKVISCRARMDGERLGIDAELAVKLRLVKNNQISTLAEVSFRDEVVRRRGEYVVCFPSAEDTLWSVAKRYHSPIATLSVANSITASADPDSRESVDGIGYLIV